MPAAKKNALSPSELAAVCDELLCADAFDDYCPNGLQVDGGAPIARVVTGVTACQRLIDCAIAKKADAILVHHGYFWKGEDPALVGPKGKRIRALLQNGVSLLAYHLPLDAHETLGNNAQLAKDLDLQIVGALYPDQKRPIGNIAVCDPIDPREFAERISRRLDRAPLHICGGKDAICKVALCSGAAQDMIEQAALMGCDAFVSGEISERTTHLARELGVHYYAAGHHATERGGVKALGKWLADRHGLFVEFVDIDNPA